MGKICFFCGSNNTVKKGLVHDHQRWFCKACGKLFSHRRKDVSEKISELYSSGKYAAGDIADILKVSRSTVCRRLKLQSTVFETPPPRKIVAMMDTTYWGWNFGVVAIKDAIRGTFVWTKFINRKERVNDYVEGVEHLTKSGFEIEAVVSDGLRGLRERLHQYKFQYCQFHQVKTIKHWLTSHPKLEASRKLLDLAYFMSDTDKASFVGLFQEWEMQWKDFIKERAVGSDGKSHYVHKNLRTAYHSLKRNMPYLWTFEDYYGQGIPNTNNGIESAFTDLKSHLRLHKGISEERRKILILKFISRHNPYKKRGAANIGYPNDT